jgi:Ca2+-binding RTX toxin-like protein
VTADDSHTGTDTQTVTITIIGTNDAPMITSNNSGDSANVFVPENTMFVTNVDAGDPDTGALLKYEILPTSGTDFAAFNINSSSGVLTFASPPDFEVPTDVGGTPGDNTYVVDVQVSDGFGGTDTQSIAVTVTGSHAVTANNDIVLTNVLQGEILIPGSALLANDTDSLNHPLHIGAVANATPNGFGDVIYVVNVPLGSFDYSASDGEVESAPAHVTVTTQEGVVMGAQENEILLAGDDDDFMDGFAGDDFLFGGAGGDSMFGDEGNDTLVGGFGDDYLEGGAGSDIFDYNAILDAGTEGDTIADFNKLEGDKLDLHDLLTTFNIPGGNENALTAEYLRFMDSLGNTLIQVDSDGGVDSFQTLATISGVTLTSAETDYFIL